MSGVSRGEDTSDDSPEILVNDNATLWQGDNYGTLNINTLTRIEAPPKPSSVSKVLVESLLFAGWNARQWDVNPAFDKTCQWVFVDEAFQVWIHQTSGKNDARFLWIKGKAGSGKSTIMKEIITWFRESQPERTVLSHFFNARSLYELEHSTLGLYRSLTYQLLDAHSSVTVQFSKMFAGKVRNGTLLSEWTVAELNGFWHNFLTGPNVPSLVILVDALDESEEDDIRCVIDNFVQLARHSKARNNNFGFCLSSRPYPTITIKQSLSIAVEDHTGHKKDMTHFVYQSLKRKSGVDDHQIRKILFDRSQGVFLWVALAIVDQNKLYDRGYDLDFRARRLEDVPEDLHEALLDRMIRKSHAAQLTETQDIKQRIQLFRWVLFSIELLSAEHLHAVLQISSLPQKNGTISSNSKSRSATNHEEKEGMLLHLSQGLLEFIRPPSYIRHARFIHQSVRDLLLSTANARRPGSIFASRQDFLASFQADRCHHAIAEDCLLYLKNSAGRAGGSSELARYACTYWAQHLQAVNGRISENLVSLAVDFLVGTDEPLVLNRGYYVLCRSPTWTRTGVLPFDCGECPWPIYYAALTGSPDLVSAVIDRGTKINANRVELLSAMEIASEMGYDKVVQVLLERSSQVPSKSQRIINSKALLAASRGGHEKVARVLLDWNAHFTVGSSYQCTALVDAADLGHDKVVETLLEFRVDVVFGKWQYRQALMYALFRGHEKVVKILIRHSINTGAQVDCYNEALLEAARGGHANLIELCLEAGANINFRGARGTALTIATYFGHGLVVQCLLQNGAIASHQDELTEAQKLASIGLRGHDPGILSDDFQGESSLYGLDFAAQEVTYPQSIDL